MGSDNSSGGFPLPAHNKTFNESISVLSNTGSLNNFQSTLLCTALVNLSTHVNKPQTCTALLDSASQSTIITKQCANKIGLQITPSTILLHGISALSTPIIGTGKLNIYTLNGQLFKESHEVIVVEQIQANLPFFAKLPELQYKLNQISLADPNFNNSPTISIIIGADLFGLALRNHTIQLGAGLPTAIETIFGYCLIGTIPTASYHSNNISLLTTSDMSLHNLLQKFWTLEEVPVSTKTSKEELACDNHYNSTVTRNATGRYIVSLPFAQDPQSLGDSFNTAKRRFSYLENKFANKPELKVAYSAFMSEYLKSNHMSLLPTQVPDAAHYFLPHHAVFKTSSSTTKLRVVFDGSSKTTSGLSINDIQFAGPKLQTDICEVILQFRTHNIVFSTDIQQMYRQILIHPDDQNFQLILWRENPCDPLSTYKLNTVTYGLKSSPYLAIRTLRQLVQDEGHNFPLAAEALLSHIYVDDIITGSKDIPSALELQHQLIELLSKGQFQLRKWTSNCSELLADITQEHREVPLYFRSPDQPLFNILGLKWTPLNDLFSFTIQLPSLDHSPTKRSILSTIAQIYDPCGFLSPTTFFAKCLMQHLWTLGINWDSPVPEVINSAWRKFVQELPHLENISISRCINLHQSTNIQIHGFCDASDKGYSAVIYIRTTTSTNIVNTQLLLAKSKVAPLKRISLPRLELCGAHLLAKLMHYCLQFVSTRCSIDIIKCWCDSMVTLAWITTPPYKLKVYIANRVSQIQDWTPTDCWSHVPSGNNPADCSSRGLSPSALLNHHIWFSGPSWLKLSDPQWPKSPSQVLDTVPELRSNPLPICLASFQTEWNILSKFSSWSKTLYVMSYVLRFCHNVRTASRVTGPVNLTELQSTELQLIKLVQKSHFSKEIQLLNTNPTSCCSRLASLSPFLDHNGILRVGGRIKFSSLNYTTKHPAVLPKNHHITFLIIDHYHCLFLHAGPLLLQSVISKKFWILSARSTIRKQIHKCLRCFKLKPTSRPPLMGDLPRERVTFSQPFINTGCDYCGPFIVKIHTLRRAQEVKVYLCIFVCFATKAIHVEVATDLSTQAFIDALTRFVSRRGLCSNLYSDCGTNFVGASNNFKKIILTMLNEPLSKETIDRFTKLHGIKFHFLPPAAPHQGGLWESAVKSVKTHLLRTIGNEKLYLMDFVTLATKIEGILNSRPLTPLSADPNELDVLTPAHFLIGRPITALPEPAYEQIPLNRLKHWQRVQCFSQQIWKRWHLEYLHTLQQRLKWNRCTPNLQPGDLVLIQDSNVKPLCWPTGRVLSTSPGEDGVVRVATIKTKDGVFTRPAVKLFSLPLSN